MTSRIALGVILLGAGSAWLLAQAGVLDLSYGTWIGLALIAIGLAIALTPGRHGLLATLGVLVVLAGLPALFVDDVDGDVGDTTVAPSAPAQIEHYEHGIGKLTVDLTAPGLARADLDVEADLGIGELLVLVPTGADVTVDAHVGLGNVMALGRQADGVGVDLTDTFPASGKHAISLDLANGVGDIRVERR